jgi:hypothetical protein
VSLLAERAPAADPAPPPIPVPSNPAAEMVPAMIELLLAESARRTDLVVSLKPHLDPGGQDRLAGPLCEVATNASKLVARAHAPDATALHLVRAGRALGRSLNALEDSLWTELVYAAGGTR